MIQTVLGSRPRLPEGFVDAHAHVWIDGVEGTDAGAFVLADEPAISAELRAFAARGGAALVDCMPGGAGRNVGRLARISAESGLAIVASTGFHLRGYHAAGHPRNPWELAPGDCQRLFEHELGAGVAVAGREDPIRAGVIKTAHPGALDADPGFRGLFGAALAASHSTGAFLVVHTERGAGVEELADLIERSGIDPRRVMLSHIDKRPDVDLHRRLARAGYLLEYDTFLRPKYDPDRTVWPLLEAMISDGLDDAVACALDLADPLMWTFGGGGHGAGGLATVVAPRLLARGVPTASVAKVTGGTIRERLAAAPLG